MLRKTISQPILHRESSLRVFWGSWNGPCIPHGYRKRPLRWPTSGVFISETETLLKFSYVNRLQPKEKNEIVKEVAVQFVIRCSVWRIVLISETSRRHDERLRSLLMYQQNIYKCPDNTSSRADYGVSIVGEPFNLEAIVTWTYKSCAVNSFLQSNPIEKIWHR